jgi:hypothetical protein
MGHEVPSGLISLGNRFCVQAAAPCQGTMANSATFIGSIRPELDMMALWYIIQNCVRRSIVCKMFRCL